MLISSVNNILSDTLMSHQRHSIIHNWSRFMESEVTDHAANFQRVYRAD